MKILRIKELEVDYKKQLGNKLTECLTISTFDAYDEELVRFELILTQWQKGHLIQNELCLVYLFFIFYENWKILWGL